MQIQWIPSTVALAIQRINRTILEPQATVGSADQSGPAQPVDTVELSSEAQAAAEAEQSAEVDAPSFVTTTDTAQAASEAPVLLGIGRSLAKEDGGESPEEPQAESRLPGSPDEAKSEGNSAATSDESELEPEEQDQVEELKRTDQEVRRHEQAHVAAAGQYVRGGPTYEYQRGPDGKRYAIGGEVQIDTAPVPDDPQATIQKARVVRAAALAPAEPSAQDRAVAAAATKMEAEAQAELTQQRLEGTEPSEATGGQSAGFGTNPPFSPLALRQFGSSSGTYGESPRQLGRNFDAAV